MERRLSALLPGGKFEGVTPTRSRSMARIRSKGNATTEQTLRMALVRSGVRGWSLHAALAGKPDFYFPINRVAIFVDGCFWHGCKRCGHVPKTRTEFWNAKLRRNQERDRRVARQLRAEGVRVIRVWEHRLNNPRLLARTTLYIQGLLAQPKPTI
jgi:DNA mismatch endonuclease (patch repair protein)